MKYLAVVEDFLLGRLKGKALKDFREKLKSDSDLRNEVTVYLKAHEFTKSEEKKLINYIRKMKDFQFDAQHIQDIMNYKGMMPLNKEEEKLINLLQSEKASLKKKDIQ